MAEVVLDPQYEGFAKMILGRLTVKNAMELTPHARDFVRLSAESWRADASLLPMRENSKLGGKSLADLSEIQQDLLAAEIVDLVKVHPHVRQQIERHESVPFQSLVVAFADAGRRRLSEEVRKGF